MRSSLRFKLLGWQMLILVGLILVFGSVLWFQVRRSIFRAVDRELRQHATVLATTLQPRDDTGFDLNLSQREMEYFRQEGAAAPYFAMWQAGGNLIDSSDPAMSIPVPDAARIRNRGERREVIVDGPKGSRVLVGRDIEQEHEHLDELFWTISAIGGATLLLTLGGSWFLTGRALAPIGRITRATEQVSASNLQQRIDPAQMESELENLSITINRAFDRLQQAIERQARFTADASHELRTPLSIIVAHADSALSRDDRTTTEYRDYLETIQRAGGRMKTIIEGLLTLARADGDPSSFRTEQVDLADVIRDVVGMLAPLANQKAVQFDLALHPSVVQGDRDRLTEAISNLLSNAILYNHDGGKVTVCVNCQDGVVNVRITDTGMGIPARDLPHVFERFYRVDKARSRTIGGSGLGLSIAQWIIQKHGGSIQATSDGTTGSEFVVKLPVRA